MLTRVGIGILGAWTTAESLGEFVRSRRARVSPEDVGLADFGRRRVPGLGREELAQLTDAARDTVAHLRLLAGRHPDDLGLAELIGELSMKSEEFRRWWARHNVREKTHGMKRMAHPIVGPLTRFYEPLALRGDPDQGPGYLRRRVGLGIRDGTEPARFDD
jgi:hypothetical protein